MYRGEIERGNNQIRIGELDLVGMAVEEAKAKKKKRAQTKPDYSRFKLKFWYLDGNCSVHFSYDYTYRYPNGQKITVFDEHRGLWLLVRLIREMKAQDKFKTAVIWANLDDGNLSTDNGRYDFCVGKSYRQKPGRLHSNMKFADVGPLTALPIGVRNIFPGVVPEKMLDVQLLKNSQPLV